MHKQLPAASLTVSTLYYSDPFRPRPLKGPFRHEMPTAADDAGGTDADATSAEWARMMGDGTAFPLNPVHLLVEHRGCWWDQTDLDVPVRTFAFAVAMEQVPRQALPLETARKHRKTLMMS